MTAGGSRAVVERRKRQGSERNGGGSNSVVESQPSKLLVAGSIPVSRSRLRQTVASLLATSRQASGDRTVFVGVSSVRGADADEVWPKLRT